MTGTAFRHAYALFVDSPNVRVGELVEEISLDSEPITLRIEDEEVRVLFDSVQATAPEAEAKVASALSRAQKGQRQVIFVCLPLHDAGEHMETALDHITRHYQKDSLALLYRLVHVLLVAPNVDHPAYETLPERSNLWERNVVCNVSRASLVAGLESALSPLSLPAESPSTLPLPPALESLVTSDDLLLNPLASGDLLSVLRDQVIATAGSRIGGLPWNDGTAEALLEKLKKSNSPVTETPLTEMEARQTLATIGRYMPIALSFSVWAPTMDPPLTVTSSDGKGGIGCQPLRWLSYLPNGFFGKEASRRFLLYLHIDLYHALHAALRLHALGVYTAEDLYAYCKENGIMADAASLSAFASAVCDDGGDQERLMVLCGRLVVEGYQAAAQDEAGGPGHLSASVGRGGQTGGREGVPARAANVARGDSSERAGAGGGDGDGEEVGGEYGSAPSAAEAWCQGCEGVIDAMDRPFVERKTECTLLLLGLLSGANVFIHGPPGVAKSMLARRLFPFFERGTAGQPFKIVLSKTTLPDELLGPVSITAAKEDRFERNTSGYLPEAPLAFIDEIFNASNAILNALLSIINERIFRNGTKDMTVPLEMVVAASTDFPPSVLAPFYDRFLIRVDIQRLATTGQWKEMLQRRYKYPMARQQPAVPSHQLLSPATLADIRERSRSVIPSRRVLHFLSVLPGKVLAAGKNRHYVDISERRLGSAQDTLQTAAAVRALIEDGGKSQINLLDLALIQHMLWAVPADHDVLKVGYREALNSCLEVLPIESEIPYFQQVWKATPWKAAIACSGPVGELGRSILAELGIEP